MEIEQRLVELESCLGLMELEKEKISHAGVQFQIIGIEDEGLEIGISGELLMVG